MPARPLDKPSAIRAGRKNINRTKQAQTGTPQNRPTKPERAQGSQGERGEAQPRAPWNWLRQATSAAPLGGDAAGGAGG
jgi:hypothetical protein